METEQPTGGDSIEELEANAGRVLEGYRERRRKRRAEDTYFGSSDCLLVSAEEGAASAELVRRRIDVIEEAQSVGMSPELAEMLYDIARDEGLDPALGYELVRCGIGVCPPEDGVINAPTQSSSDPYMPEWLAEPLPTDHILRERMLRLSFRRLRGLLETHDSPDEAIRAFAREPDVGHYGF